tara:strand:+ start:954 stop:1892 length:939 start_codon:yes stop_codon:yes gene_type:complete
MAFKLRSGFLKAGGFKKMGASSPNKKTYAEAKAADPKLDSYIKQRGDYEAGSEAYEKLQAKINKAYGKTRDTKSQMRDTAKLQPKKMEGKQPTQINTDGSKKTSSASSAGKAAGGAAATAAAATAGKTAAKGASKAAKGVDKPNLKVGSVTTGKGESPTSTVQYVKKSAANAPGKGGDFDRSGDKPKTTTTPELTKSEQRKSDKKAKKKAKADEKTAKYLDSKKKNRFDLKVEADKMVEQSGGKLSKREARKAISQQKEDEASLTAKEAADKAERKRLGGQFAIPKDPKSSMTKKASPNKIYNKPKGKRTKY